MPLTATAVKQAKPREKAYKLFDGGGLYLLVNPNGSKYWRYKYRFLGKENHLALGTFPEVSLAEARAKHLKSREQLADGKDPAEVRKLERLTRHIAAADTFEAIAHEWFTIRMVGKSKSHRDRTLRLFENHLFPGLRGRPISAITAPEILAILRKIDNQGKVETAHRAKQAGSQVFRYAIQTGRAERDPCADLTGALRSPKKTHIAAITEPAEAGKLMVAIDGFQGTAVVHAALKLSALTFLRPGEIRQLEWSDVNWVERRIEIPAERMKMRVAHIVPLSTQADIALKELHRLTGNGRYLFPSPRGASRCLSDNGVRTALRTMGYDNQTMSPHGFRAMARTLLDEVLGYRIDWIEHQLAHAVRDPNGRAYNRTSHFEGRAQMMQGWADYLDSLKEQALAKSP
jgi:integrase